MQAWEKAVIFFVSDGDLSLSWPDLDASQGRYVTLLRLEGKVYCIDSVCFHAGGPLVGLLSFNRALALLCCFPSSTLRHLFCLPVLRVLAT